ncbi:hypothetical protein O3Q51_17190 [Cryomorphaceae bacterium 1068]|nr:hypothetical protein [Cryomorphaceae bacterium 1068]
MNLRFFFLGAVLCVAWTGCNHQSEVDEYNASLMYFVFEGVENSAKVSKMRLYAYYQENREKYGEAYRVGEQVVAINQSFVDRVDSMLINSSEPVDDEEFYQLFVATIDSLNNCLKRSGDLTWFNARSVRELHPKANNLTLLLARQASTQYCNEILEYLVEDMSGCGWRFPNVQYELVNSTRLILSERIYQQCENRALEISSFTKDGIPIEKKIRSKNSAAFAEVTFDSLPPGNYKVEGILKMLIGSSRFVEEPIEYRFSVTEDMP